jgi:hypothetical protein
MWMKVRILKRIVGHVDGVSLRHYRPKQIYDVPPSLANYLVAQGVALFEMRNPEARHPPPEGEERRRDRLSQGQASDEEYSS